MAIVDMPDRLVSLLFRFLRQQGGVLSQWARSREFQALTEQEVAEVETLYRHYFPAEPPLPV